MGSLSLLQGIFLTQESNQDLLRCRRILYQLSYESLETSSFIIGCKQTCANFALDGGILKIFDISKLPSVFEGIIISTFCVCSLYKIHEKKIQSTRLLMPLLTRCAETSENFGELLPCSLSLVMPFCYQLEKSVLRSLGSLVDPVVAFISHLLIHWLYASKKQ